MGRAREVGWMAAGLMIGAGACYCVYKLTIGRDDSDKLEEEEDEWDEDEALDEEEPDMWFDFTTMARPWNEDGDWIKPGAPGGSEDRPSGGGKANRTYLIKERPSPYGHKNTWSTTVNNMSVVLDLSKCPFIQVKMLFAQAREAGFPSTHNTNCDLPSLPITRSMVPTPRTAVKEKAVRALDMLNGSVEHQGQIKMYISEVCQETVSHCCNSFLQQAGLNLLKTMTVINHMLAKSVSDLKFPLIAEGNGCAEDQILKPLMSLSEKAALAGELLSAQMLFSFMSLFIRSGNRDVLLDVPAP
ncbi:protein ARMCX6-like [Tamandua tetradactyla]|uniref:protein ARMCX6-like n=1 Tax=Tamandua tetradactyla TaxID=48850 RepID=UPI0040539B92